MRSGMKDPEFIEDNGKLIGVQFSAGYCAEHEWGIEKLCAFFGIKKYGLTEGPFGIERRRSTQAPSKERQNAWGEDFLYEENKKVAALTVGYHIFRFKPEDEKKTLLNTLPDELKTRPEQTDCLRGAWCGDSFGLVAKGKENIEKLRVLRDAIEQANVVLFNSGSGKNNPFEKPGLVVAIADAIPAEGVESMRKSDEETCKLYTAAKETGIEERILANLKSSYGGKPFFALSPKWKGNEQTKYPVVFWLNPCDQDTNNNGWFTVEQLDEWIEGKGPVPRTK